MNWFNYIITILSLYLNYRGINYVIGVYKTLLFVKNGTSSLKTKEPGDPPPRIIILLPLLREQSVIKGLVNYFARLEYPLNRLAIILVTTEKERSEKLKNSANLKQLTHDLTSGTNEEKILERYLGIFPRTQLKRLVKQVNSGLVIDLSKLKHLYNQQKTTIELAERIIKRKNLQLGKKIFFHAHYPETEGVMAHQLNYVMKNLKNIVNFNLNEDQTYIGVYNADSKPNLKTLLSLKRESENYKVKQGLYPEVFQQISAYTANYQAYNKNFIGWLLKASSIVQTRWALGFEIPMLIKQSSFWIKNHGRKLKFWEKIIEPPAYCVGHGMYVRLDILKMVGWYPTETMNEDLPLGYYLVLNKIPINPLPLLESVENPDSLSMLVAQKASWFWGMVDYFDYLSYASSKVKNYDHFRATLMALKGIKRDALAWLFSSFGILLLLISPVLLDGWWKLLPLSAVLTYAVIPSFLIVVLLPQIFKLSFRKSIKTSFGEAITVGLFSIVYLLISSIGPWKTLLNKVAVSFFKAIPIKAKTER